jgi:hypothetical protein
MMTMSKSTLITSRDPKGIAIIGLTEAALNKARLDEDQAQRVFEHGGELQEDFLAILAKYGTPNEFANEEVPSNYGYLSGYRKAKPLPEQMRILREYFPQLGDPDEAIAQQDRPANSEGWFAIPRWQSIASTYGEAVEKVFDALNKQRKGKFVNYRKGELGPDRLRETDRKRLAFEQLNKEQRERDVLVVAAQFGLRHRGRSVRRARAVMGGKEFGLGAFEIGIMLLTHPERLVDYNDLWVDCAGDEYSPDAGGRFVLAPSFFFYDGRLRFGSYFVDRAYAHCGSASGFLPQ